MGVLLRIEVSMAKYDDLMLSGKSGEKYCFQTWPYHTRFRSVGAVFSVTKRLFNNKTFHRASHEVIYIGQTSSMSEPFATLSQLEAFEKHGVNCVCVYRAMDKAQRMNIVEDLMGCQNPILKS
jgi:hypothetical protein